MGMKRRIRGRKRKKLSVKELQEIQIKWGKGVSRDCWNSKEDQENQKTI